MKNVVNIKKNSTIFKENVQKLDTICKNFFLSLIGSTAFKLLDNALMKAHSLYGHGGGKKSFKETKMCGVIVTLKVLFVEPKNELSIFHFLFTLRNIKKIENVLEFRQQICF